MDVQVLVSARRSEARRRLSLSLRRLVDRRRLFTSPSRLSRRSGSGRLESFPRRRIPSEPRGDAVKNQRKDSIHRPNKEPKGNRRLTDLFWFVNPFSTDSSGSSNNLSIFHRRDFLIINAWNVIELKLKTRRGFFSLLLDCSTCSSQQSSLVFFPPFLFQSGSRPGPARLSERAICVFTHAPPPPTPRRICMAF